MNHRALTAMAMVAATLGVSLGIPDGDHEDAAPDRRPSDPRDQERIDAAKAKRARKNAKRAALTKGAPR